MEDHEIVSKSLEIYDRIKPKNPPNSYTVIATLNDHVSGELRALASGTQACLGQYPDDLQDCHAEALTKRAYKRYLINVVKNIVENSFSTEEAKQQIRQNCHEDLTLFVSKFPCGFIKRYAGDESIDEKTGEILRRKPGRGTIIDNKCIYVEKDDCFTKLKGWLNTGVQGKKLGQLLNVECRIKKILIGKCEAETNSNYVELLEQFKDFLLISSDQITVKMIDFVKRDEFIYDAARQPQPVSLVAWKTYPPVSESIVKTPHEEPKYELEMIVDGRKQGLTRKQCQLKTNCLQVGNHKLRNDIESIKKYFEDF